MVLGPGWRQGGSPRRAGAGPRWGCPGKGVGGIPGGGAGGGCPGLEPPPGRRLPPPPRAGRSRSRAEPVPGRLIAARRGGSMATTVPCTRFTDEYQLYEEIGK